MATSAASPVITDAAASVNGESGRLLDDLGRRRDHVLGEGAGPGSGGSEHFVARRQVGDSRADGGHHAGEVAAPDRALRTRSPAPRRRMYDVRASREVS